MYASWLSVYFVRGLTAEGAKVGPKFFVSYKLLFILHSTNQFIMPMCALVGPVNVIANLAIAAF